MSELIENLKIVEIASVLAGPSVGMFFSELGADVIKIENKITNGDVTRSWKLNSEDESTNVSAYFSSVNYNKKYIFADFTDKKDLFEIKNLISTADILITNFKKGDDLKFGLDYFSLSKLNPKLIYASINGFGSQSDRVAFDLILQAESGFMSMNGTPESGPVKMPVALIDVLAGHQLKEGVLVALLDRITSGRGKKVEVSLFDSAIASLANQATNWLMAKHNPKRIGSLHPNIAPYGEIFQSKDNKEITLAIGSDKQFKNLCIYLGVENLIDNSKYSSNTNRVKNRIELAKILANEINKFIGNDLLIGLHKVFVPIAKINSVKDVFENPDAQKLILEEEIEGVKTKRVKTVIFK
jgi:crotonobetainyl-CoA:carnitine CoA-transferase CaiB-like acyl-CoA transferase